MGSWYDGNVVSDVFMLFFLTFAYGFCSGQADAFNGLKIFTIDVTSNYYWLVPTGRKEFEMNEGIVRLWHFRWLPWSERNPGTLREIFPLLSDQSGCAEHWY